MSGTPALFTPLQVGAVKVQHRVVLAPLTRFRANAEHEHTALGVEYYTQRAGTPGTLLISEAALVAPQVGAWRLSPGVWSDAQLASWRKITDAVHACGSFMFAQLWAIGRFADKDGDTEGRPLVGASAIPLAGLPAPRPLTPAEIAEWVQLFAAAAKNSVERADFDGVEVDCANGYLIDQFLQTNSNNRTDAYGGSLEGRLRFALEVVAAVTAVVGAERTGVRISPWSRYGDMRMEDPMPTFVAFVERLKASHPDLAYLHVIEPRVVGNNDEAAFDAKESNKVLRDVWGARPFIAAGGFTRESALETAEKEGGLIAFGRAYIANPDLPLRLKKAIALTPHNRATFYTSGPLGYTDYAFASA